MKQSFWTHELRRRIFLRILAEFGPHREWGAMRRPKGQTKKYNALLSELASEISKELGRNIKATAIGQQIDWGITKQVPMQDQARVRNFILNKAAALEAGLISSSDLPFLLMANSK